MIKTSPFALGGLRLDIERPVDFTATLEWGYGESRYLSVVRILN